VSSEAGQERRFEGEGRIEVASCAVWEVWAMTDAVQYTRGHEGAIEEGREGGGCDCGIGGGDGMRRFVGLVGVHVRRGGSLFGCRGKRSLVGSVLSRKSYE